MATVKDIANRTGLGLATISKYLNGGRVREENRIAIEAAVRELHYTVNTFARGLKTNRSHTVGVVIPELRNLFITTMITEVEDILRQNGYSMVVCDCRTDPVREAQAVSFLLEKRVDGIISMPVSRDGASFLPSLQAGIPVVFLDRLPAPLRHRTDAVLLDNLEASRLAAGKLLSAGHRTVGIIAGPREVYTTRRRLRGFLAAIREQNGTAVAEYGDYTVEGGYGAMGRLLSRQRQTGMSAVFVTNYEMTLGAIISINEAGLKIPRQMSFIGFDSLESAKAFNPPLALLSQPLEQMGARAAQLLLDRLEGQTGAPPVTARFSAALSPGESVCPPELLVGGNQ